MDLFDSKSDEDIKRLCAFLIMKNSPESFKLICDTLMINDKLFDLCRDLLFEKFSNGNDVLVKISDQICAEIGDNNKHIERFEQLSGTVIRVVDLCSTFDKIWSLMTNGNKVCFDICMITPNHKTFHGKMVIMLMIIDNIRKIRIHNNSSFGDYFSIKRLHLEQDPADVHADNCIVIREDKFPPIISYIEKYYIIAMTKPPSV